MGHRYQETSVTGDIHVARSQGKIDTTWNGEQPQVAKHNLVTWSLLHQHVHGTFELEDLDLLLLIVDVRIGKFESRVGDF
jgi:hypothetical protein